MEKIKPQSSYSKQKSQVISLEKGKIPPQALDLEEVVLGAMMVDKRGVDEVIDILHPEVFYKQAHQQIFEAIFMLFKEGLPIDLLTVSSKLKTQKKLESIGGDFYLIQKKEAHASNFEPLNARKSKALEYKVGPNASS